MGSGSNTMKISHLLYADDTLVLCDVSVEQKRHLRLIQTGSEALYGLKVNWRKSFMFSVNQLQDISSLAGTVE